MIELYSTPAVNQETLDSNVNLELTKLSSALTSRQNYLVYTTHSK